MRHIISMQGLNRALSALILTVLFLGQSTGVVFAQDTRKLERDNTSAGAVEKRVALVIGNGAYTKAKPLPNPANDAADMAKALKDVGFDVLSGVDLDKRQMENLIREFGVKLASGGVGLFYYAGHGIQVGGENYLVPIDAEIPEENEVSYAAVSVSLVLTKMAGARNDLNIVILDACRNNPFARSWRGYRDSSNSDGLAKISPPTGTLVLYATEPGKVASDGTGRNGLFTEALLKQIIRPNIEYDQMVKALSADVWQKSNRQQLPWKEGNSLQDFYFLKTSGLLPAENSTAAVPKPTPLPTPTPVVVAQNVDAEELYWQEISRQGSRSAYELYLAEYPRGKHLEEAKNWIEKFKVDEQAQLKAAERAKWLETRLLDSKDAYNAYLTAYPYGAFAADARLGISAIETREEQAKWEEVQILNRKTAFQAYLSAYPGGKYASAARQKIREFDDAEAIRLKEQEKANERAKWDDADLAKTAAGYKAYLTAYPTGEFASLARLRLRDLGVVLDPSTKPAAGNNNPAAGKTAGSISKATLPGNVEMSFAYIPAGEFQMGSSNGESDEKPVHTVKISQGFWMQTTEVTQAQWKAVMGASPSYFKDCPNCPVEQLSWEDAQQFISKMNAQNDGYKYRLPTEAEWEYAARAGTSGDYAGDLDSMAWYSNNSGSKTHEVGTKSPNGWGLFDMHGNVWEWVQDWYGDYPGGTVTDPAGAASGSYRVYRGGSWSFTAGYLRSAYRYSDSPSYRDSRFGFRLLRN